jgi:hypothetical protein
MTDAAPDKDPGADNGMPQPDTAAAIEFLRRWRPSGVLTLVAILPDKKPEEIDGRSWITERPGVWNQIGRWIDGWQGKRNLYFTANEARRMDKKPAKTDIKRIWANFSDADPDTSEGYAVGRARLLDEMLPRFIGGDLPATVTIDSGNGLQGLWQRVDGEPVTEGAVKEFEAINKPFSEAMGSKGIFNVDRLLRLPGTINLPKKAKLSKGYPAEPTIARLIHSCGVRYTTEQIKEWTEKAQAEAATQVKAEAEAKRQQRQDHQQDHQLAGLPEALRTRFAAHLKSDPILGRRWRGDTTGLKDTSRSAFDMSLGAQLKQRGYSLNEMTAILRIFPHGAGAEQDDRYFERIWGNSGQQAGADGAANSADVDAVIHDFNQKYAVVNEAGKIVVYRPKWDDQLKRAAIERILFEDFRRMYMNQRIQAGISKKGTPLYRDVATVWLEHPARRQFLGGVVMDPTGKAPPDCWNLWKGFTVTAKPGDWSLMHDHIRDVICGGDAASAGATRRCSPMSWDGWRAWSSIRTSRVRWRSSCAARKGRAKERSAIG